MKRKLIQQGGGKGITVYLPKEWTEQQGWQAGEEVEITAEGNTLRISSEFRKKKKEITFEIKDEDVKNLRYILKQLYRQGNEIIILKYHSEKQYKLVETIIAEEFIGLEISEKSENFCRIESIVEVKEDKYEIFLKKIFQIIHYSLELLGKKENLAEITKLTQRLSAYQNFGKMAVANLRKDLIDYEHYSLLSYLLNIQADLNKLTEEILSKKLNLNKNYLLEEARIFQEIEKAFFKNDLESLVKINKEIHQFIDVGLKRSFSLEKKQLIGWHYYLENLRLMYGMISPMIGIIINQKKANAHDRF